MSKSYVKILKIGKVRFVESSEAKIVDMNASTVTPTPVEEVVSAMPVTDTNLENNQAEDTTAPSVVAIPEEKPVVEEL